DQNDGFGMPDEPQTSYSSIGVDTYENVNRLARIADGTGEIGIEIDVSCQFVSAVDRSERRVALNVPETIRAFEQLARLCLRQEFRQPTCRRCGERTGNQNDRCESQQIEWEDQRVQPGCADRRICTQGAFQSS